MHLLFTPYLFDLEVTNLCNTRCAFCPREAIERPKGYMSEETFDFFLNRLKNFVSKMANSMVYSYFEKFWARPGTGKVFPIRVVCCGMGECLTHKHTPEWVGRIRSEVGVRASIVTNGALLSKDMIRRLIAADVSAVNVSVNGLDREIYGRYMELDWDTTLANVESAHAMLPGKVWISVTIPRDAPFGTNDVLDFWKARGIPVGSVDPCHSRGGFLRDENLIATGGPVQSSVCGIIARNNFVAWDGRILSCCHDLRGENVIGSLHSDGMFDIFTRKTGLITSRAKFAICERCDDPQRGDLRNIATMDENRLK